MAAQQDQLIEIKLPDIKNVQKRLGDLQHKAPTAMSRAINKTITHVRKSMSDEVRKEYIVKAGTAKKTIRVKKASSSNLSGEAVSSSSEKIPLKGFTVSPAKRNPDMSDFYKSQVKRSSSLKALTGSSDRSAGFIATMKSGHVGVFERQKDAGRLPIAELYGPAIPSMLASRKLSEATINDGQTFMAKAIDQEIKRMLEASR